MHQNNHQLLIHGEDQQIQIIMEIVGMHLVQQKIGHNQQLILMKIHLLVRKFKQLKRKIFFVYLETSQYRALYDYIPERSDEMAISAGDIITVSKLI